MHSDYTCTVTRLYFSPAVPHLQCIYILYINTCVHAMMGASCHKSLYLRNILVIGHLKDKAFFIKADVFYFIIHMLAKTISSLF